MFKTIQQASNDGAIAFYISTQSLIVSYDNKVYVFPRQHDIQEMIAKLCYMFTVEEAEVLPFYSEFLKGLKCINESMLEIFERVEGVPVELVVISKQQLLSIEKAATMESERNEQAANVVDLALIKARKSQ